LLKARAAQAGQPVLLDGALPRPVLLLGQFVALQRLFEGDAAGAQRTYFAGTRPKTFRQFWNIPLTQVTVFLLLDHLAAPIAPPGRMIGFWYDSPSLKPNSLLAAN
jgi:hypothetical protein